MANVPIKARSFTNRSAKKDEPPERRVSGSRIPRKRNDGDGLAVPTLFAAAGSKPVKLKLPAKGSIPQTPERKVTEKELLAVPAAFAKAGSTPIKLKIPTDVKYTPVETDKEKELLAVPAAFASVGSTPVKLKIPTDVKYTPPVDTSEKDMLKVPAAFAPATSTPVKIKIPDIKKIVAPDSDNQENFNKLPAAFTAAGASPVKLKIPRSSGHGGSIPRHSNSGGTIPRHSNSGGGAIPRHSTGGGSSIPRHSTGSMRAGGAKPKQSAETMKTQSSHTAQKPNVSTVKRATPPTAPPMSPAYVSTPTGSRGSGLTTAPNSAPTGRAPPAPKPFTASTPPARRPPPPPVPSRVRGNGIGKIPRPPPIPTVGSGDSSIGTASSHSIGQSSTHSQASKASKPDESKADFMSMMKNLRNTKDQRRSKSNAANVKAHYDALYKNKGMFADLSTNDARELMEKMGKLKAKGEIERARLTDEEMRRCGEVKRRLKNKRPEAPTEVAGTNLDIAISNLEKIKPDDSAKESHGEILEKVLKGLEKRVLPNVRDKPEFAHTISDCIDILKGIESNLQARESEKLADVIEKLKDIQKQRKGKKAPLAGELSNTIAKFKKCNLSKKEAENLALVIRKLKPSESNQEDRYMQMVGKRLQRLLTSPQKVEKVSSILKRLRALDVSEDDKEEIAKAVESFGNVTLEPGEVKDLEMNVIRKLRDDVSYALEEPAATQLDVALARMEQVRDITEDSDETQGEVIEDSIEALEVVSDTLKAEKNPLVTKVDDSINKLRHLGLTQYENAEGTYQEKIQTLKKAKTNRPPLSAALTNALGKLKKCNMSKSEAEHVAGIIRKVKPSESDHEVEKRLLRHLSSPSKVENVSSILKGMRALPMSEDDQDQVAEEIESFGNVTLEPGEVKDLEMNVIRKLRDDVSYALDEPASTQLDIAMARLEQVREITEDSNETQGEVIEDSIDALEEVSDTLKAEKNPLARTVDASIDKLRHLGLTQYETAEGTYQEKIQTLKKGKSVKPPLSGALTNSIGKLKKCNMSKKEAKNVAGILRKLKPSESDQEVEKRLQRMLSTPLKVENISSTIKGMRALPMSEDEQVQVAEAVESFGNVTLEPGEVKDLEMNVIKKLRDDVSYALDEPASTQLDIALARLEQVREITEDSNETQGEVIEDSLEALEEVSDTLKAEKNPLAKSVDDYINKLRHLGLTQYENCEGAIQDKIHSLKKAKANRRPLSGAMNNGIGKLKKCNLSKKEAENLAGVIRKLKPSESDQEVEKRLQRLLTSPHKLEKVSSTLEGMRALGMTENDQEQVAEAVESFGNVTLDLGELKDLEMNVIGKLRDDVSYALEEPAATQLEIALARLEQVPEITESSDETQGEVIEDCLEALATVLDTLRDEGSPLAKTVEEAINKLRHLGLAQYENAEGALQDKIQSLKKVQAPTPVITPKTRPAERELVEYQHILQSAIEGLRKADMTNGEASLVADVITDLHKFGGKEIDDAFVRSYEEKLRANLFPPEKVNEILEVIRKLRNVKMVKKQAADLAEIVVKLGKPKPKGYSEEIKKAINKLRHVQLTPKQAQEVAKIMVNLRKTKFGVKPEDPSGIEFLLRKAGIGDREAKELEGIMRNLKKVDIADKDASALSEQIKLRKVKIEPKKKEEKKPAEINLRKVKVEPKQKEEKKPAEINLRKVQIEPKQKEEKKPEINLRKVQIEPKQKEEIKPEINLRKVQIEPKPKEEKKPAEINLKKVVKEPEPEPKRELDDDNNKDEARIAKEAGEKSLKEKAKKKKDKRKHHKGKKEKEEEKPTGEKSIRDIYLRHTGGKEPDLPPKSQKNLDFYDGRHVWKHKKHNKSIMGDRRYQVVRSEKERIAGKDGSNVNMHYTVLSRQQQKRRKFVGEALLKSLGGSEADLDIGPPKKRDSIAHVPKEEDDGEDKAIRRNSHHV